MNVTSHVYASIKVIVIHTGIYLSSQKMASTAGSTAVDTQVSGGQNGGISQRFSDFLAFLYDSEEGKVLGRGAKSWCKYSFHFR